MTNFFENNNFNQKETFFKMLKKTYGLGNSSITLFHRLSGISLTQPLTDLESDQLELFAKQIFSKKLLLNQELKKKRKSNLDKLIEIKSYKGLRRAKGYPARGQRTRSNAKTARKKII